MKFLIFVLDVLGLLFEVGKDLCYETSLAIERRDIKREHVLRYVPIIGIYYCIKMPSMWSIAIQLVLSVLAIWIIF